MVIENVGLLVIELLLTNCQVIPFATVEPYHQTNVRCPELMNHLAPVLQVALESHKMEEQRTYPFLTRRSNIAEVSITQPLVTTVVENEDFFLH